MKKYSGQLIYSPSDLVIYLKSPFASWMDRYRLENPGMVTPDEETEDEKLIAQTGDQHERAILDELRVSVPNLVDVPKDDPVLARTTTRSAIKIKGTHYLSGVSRRWSVRGIRRFPHARRSRKISSVGHETGSFPQALLRHSALLLLGNARCRYPGATA